ncbi:MAG: HNH endonuclease signature motif containing protein [Polyangiales bacterium]
MTTTLLRAGESISGPKSLISFLKTVEYQSDHKEYSKQNGQTVLVFENSKGGEVRLFEKIVIIARDYLLQMSDMEALDTENFRAKLRTSLCRKNKPGSKRQYTPLFPDLTAVDWAYINVAKYLIYKTGARTKLTLGGVVPRQVLARQGQAAFREEVLRRCKRRCVVTGCALIPLLDAAHIIPFAKTQKQDPDNGLALRTDIHTLFDLGLLRLKPAGGVSVELYLDTSVCRDPQYQAIPKQIRVPLATLPALAARWEAVRQKKSKS